VRRFEHAKRSDRADGATALPAATIELPYWPFALIMTGETTLRNEIDTGIAEVTGSLKAVSEVIDSFEKVAQGQRKT
jgi:hypothetical protein